VKGLVRGLLPLWAILWFALGPLSLPSPAAALSCTVSAGNHAFGSYSPFSPSTVDSASTVQVSCSATIIAVLVSYDIQLSTGQSGTYSPRRMASGSNNLLYNLYTNSARTTVWGDGTAGTSIVSDSYLVVIGTTARNYSVYGRVPALQNAPPGSFADTITVTLNY